MAIQKLKTQTFEVLGANFSTPPQSHIFGGELIMVPIASGGGLKTTPCGYQYLFLEVPDEK